MSRQERTSHRLQLVSHPLCPYVQRAVIVATEKGVELERVMIDLAAKPEWFSRLSPTGKVPLLRLIDEVGEEHVIFESAVICEFIDETTLSPILPTNPLGRAKVRAWVEFASGTLADIAGLYGAADEAAFEARSQTVRRRLRQVDEALTGPWFSGSRFGFVDAAFAPVFRYLDVFEACAGLMLAEGLPKVTEWRSQLAARASIANAVTPDYTSRLIAFLRAKNSHLSDRMQASKV